MIIQRGAAKWEIFKIRHLINLLITVGAQSHGFEHRIQRLRLVAFWFLAKIFFFSFIVIHLRFNKLGFCTSMKLKYLKGRHLIVSKLYAILDIRDT